MGGMISELHVGAPGCLDDPGITTARAKEHLDE
jgi:hypothetical protein